MIHFYFYPILSLFCHFSFFFFKYTFIWDAFLFSFFFVLFRPFKPLFMDARILSPAWRGDFVVQNINKLCWSSARISWCYSFCLYVGYTSLQRAKTKSISCYWLSKGKLAYCGLFELEFKPFSGWQRWKSGIYENYDLISNCQDLIIFNNNYEKKEWLWEVELFEGLSFFHSQVRV